MTPGGRIRATFAAEPGVVAHLHHLGHVLVGDGRLLRQRPPAAVGPNVDPLLQKLLLNVPAL